MLRDDWRKKATPYVIIVYGPAGCGGTTTLVWRFSKWLEREMEVKVASVNLDATVLNLPYKPAFDIRDEITAIELMRRYNLEPNGAIIKAVGETEKYLPNLLMLLGKNSCKYVLIDTPGIMEGLPVENR